MNQEKVQIFQLPMLQCLYTDSRNHCKNPWYGDRRRLKVNEITKVLGISNDQVHNIFHEHSGMKKITIR